MSKNRIPKPWTESLAYHLQLRRVDLNALEAADRRIREEIERIIRADIEGLIREFILSTDPKLFVSTAPAEAKGESFTADTLEEMYKLLETVKPADPIVKIVVSDLIPPPCWDTRHLGERVILANKKYFLSETRNARWNAPDPGLIMAPHFAGIPIIDDDDLALVIMAKVFKIEFVLPTRIYTTDGS